MTERDTKTALITGVLGQDGSYLAELLTTKGYQVIGTSHRGEQRTQLGGSAGGCTTSMPAATCLGGICAALPIPHELPAAGMEHHFFALPPSDLISHSPPPPQPPPPEV